MSVNVVELTDRIGLLPPVYPCGDCSIRHLSVCNAVPDAELNHLAAAVVELEVPPGKAFICEGEEASNFYNITRGSAKLIKLLPDGRQQIVGFPGPGYFLGLATSKTYAFTAEALEPMNVCKFSRAKLRTLMKDFPALEDRLLETACNELVASQEQMVLLGRKTALERLATFIANRAATGPRCPGSQKPEIRLPMTRGDIADYLGLTIETVSRSFSKLKQLALIALPRPDRLVVQDAAKLQRLADGAG